jgi:putative tricarboxylic transport membrane protein
LLVNVDCNYTKAGETIVKRPWQITCFAFLGLAVFGLITSFQYPYHDRLGPGPGFFPFWLSLISGCLSVALFVRISLMKDVVDPSGTSHLPDRAAAIRIMAILVSLLFGLAALEPLGFRITLFLFLLFLTWRLGAQNWWFTLVFASIGSFGVFHVFYYWLKVPLPIGIFGI